MVDIDLSKTVKITVVPSSSLDLTYERACRGCDLRYPRKDRTYPAENAMKAMTYCLQKCDSKIKHGHENGRPFVIKIISSEYCPPQNETKTKFKLESDAEKIPPAPQDLFLFKG